MKNTVHDMLTLVYVQICGLTDIWKPNEMLSDWKILYDTKDIGLIFLLGDFISSNTTSLFTMNRKKELYVKAMSILANTQPL